MRVRTARLTAGLAALGLLATACGTDDADLDRETATDDVEVDADGPDITVASFNFPESVILAEIYAQAMEDAGFPVERQLDLGARELIFPQLASGELSFLPEYLGSALVVGFDADPPEDLDAGVDALRDAFADDGVEVLQPAPAENANVFVVTAEFADANDVVTLDDLADVEGVTLAGPPECEERDTCFAGLVDTYGLSDLSFSSIQEASARLGGLTGGEFEVALFFSTDAVLADDALVVLQDPEGLVPPENITPVLDGAVVDAYGGELTSLLDRVSAALSTDELIALNTRAAEGVAPAEIARDFLLEQELAG